jgi:hypothetical protein
MKPTQKLNELIPHPSALIESMRNMGYRPHTALADLVDNSITARAKNVIIEVEPSSANRQGWVRIEDDGRGMTSGELYQAMRWGGDGPLTKRDAKDLGRFGLGLKTASFSMGKRLTVVSKKNGSIEALRWDLENICNTGKWIPVDGVDKKDLKYLAGTLHDPNHGNVSGTVVLITEIDKLKVDARTSSSEENNRATLIRTITGHLRLVFHRFLERNSLKLKFGAAQLGPWNLFGPTGRQENPSWLKHQEKLSDGKVGIRTFVLPHHKNLTPAEHEMLAGPLGWNAHQGFFVYRADRMILSGGWLGFSKAEEHCKLARIAIDLPNDADESWGLDVIKSKITPPAILMGDMERIAKAARTEAMKRYRFHGEAEAPEVGNSKDEVEITAFWKQINGKKEVVFRINRGHPLVEALIQNLPDSTQAEAFLHAFERLLPVAAILQQPSKTTHGLLIQPDENELSHLSEALRAVIDVICKSGSSYEQAEEIALSCQPFSKFGEELKALASKLHS